MEISLHRTSLQADECGEKLCKAQPPRLCIALYSQLGIQKMDRSLPDAGNATLAVLVKLLTNLGLFQVEALTALASQIRTGC